MTRIKICGITSAEDAQAAIAAGADALGFVFAPSPRRIGVDAAREMIRTLPVLTSTVGVFSDAPRDEIEQVRRAARLDVLQLHGDESPEFCEALSGRVLKRVRVTAGMSRGALRGEIERYAAHASILLDPGAGDGRTFDWSIAEGIEQPLVIAGGLRAENVGEVVLRLRPFAVDVSSGVESAVGVKDRRAMRAFVQAVREADDRNRT